MLPKFKYHPNPIETGSFVQGEPHECNCCGRNTEIWYESPFYSAEDVDCLCPECIASGLAAEKFNGEFQDSCSVDEVSDPQKLEELLVELQDIMDGSRNTGRLIAMIIVHLSGMLVGMSLFKWE